MPVLLPHLPGRRYVPHPPQHAREGRHPGVQYVWQVLARQVRLYRTLPQYAQMLNLAKQHFIKTQLMCFTFVQLPTKKH